MKFAGVTLTQETIAATRQHFADIYQACIAEVQAGIEPVNDPESYFAWCRQRAADVLAGKSDHTFTFLQRAHSLQTGECVALLP